MNKRIIEIILDRKKLDLNNTISDEVFYTLDEKLSNELANIVEDFDEYYRLEKMGIYDLKEILKSL